VVSRFIFPVQPGYLVGIVILLVGIAEVVIYCYGV
jgi:hypothetical protein